jgi:hypothetical protein
MMPISRFVTPEGIELTYQVPETYILSIELWGQRLKVQIFS